jgi:hypothetical protein
MAGKITRARNGLQVQQDNEEGWTDEKRERFLAHLAATCNVVASCREVGMSEPGLYKLKIRDAGFRADFEAAVAEGYSRLELLMIERAMHGTRKPVLYAGKVVTEITEYSDRVAMSLLNAHRETAQRARERSRRCEEEDPEAIGARLAALLSGMNRRMGGEG